MASLLHAHLCLSLAQPRSDASSLRTSKTKNTSSNSSQEELRVGCEQARHGEETRASEGSIQSADDRVQAAQQAQGSRAAGAVQEEGEPARVEEEEDRFELVFFELLVQFVFLIQVQEVLVGIRAAPSERV